MPQQDCGRSSITSFVCLFVVQIVLCQNNIHQQSHMNRVVTHELIHAFDHCRAHVDWFNNLKHLACSEVSANRHECIFTSVYSVSPNIRGFISVHLRHPWPLTSHIRSVHFGYRMIPLWPGLTVVAVGVVLSPMSESEPVANQWHRNVPEAHGRPQSSCRINQFIMSINNTLCNAHVYNRV